MSVNNTISQELLAYFNNSLDMLGSLDTDLKLVQANPAWQKTTGLPMTQLIGQNILDFIAPEDQMMVQLVFNEALSSLSLQSFRCYFQYKNSRQILLDWHVTPDESNQRLHLLGQPVKDVDDENTEYAHQLREILNQRYRELHILSQLSKKISSSLQLATILPEIAELTCTALNTTSAYVCDVDFVSDTTTVLSDYLSPDAVPQEQTSDIGVTYSLTEDFPSFLDWLKNPEAPLLNYMDDENLDETERKHMIEYGALSTAVVPLIVKGKVWGYLEVWESRYKRHFTDQDIQLLQTIASRVAAAVANARIYAELHASEVRYRQIVETARDFIFQTDENGTFVFANPAMLDILNYEHHEFVGKSYQEIIPEEFVDDVLSFYHVQFNERIPETYYEFPLKTKNSEPIWLGNIVQIITEDKYVRGFHVIARDISARKKVEEERELLIQDLEEFAQTVAHDLKNPLNTIIGYSNLLASIDYLHENDVQLLKSIERLSYRMNYITDELLRLAEVRNLDTIPIEALHMAQLIENVQDRLSYMIDKENAILIIADTFDVALGYAPWIEEVIANYLSNAIKYGGNPPVIEMGSTLLEDNMVQFWVRDNGAGLDEEQQARLFAKFTRLNNVRVSGYGLGLSIVKRIMDKLEGRFDVESTPNEGSTFSFILPAAPVD